MRTSADSLVTVATGYGLSDTVVTLSFLRAHGIMALPIAFHTASVFWHWTTALWRHGDPRSRRAGSDRPAPASKHRGKTGGSRRGTARAVPVSTPAGLGTPRARNVDFPNLSGSTARAGPLSEPTRNRIANRSATAAMDSFSLKGLAFLNRLDYKTRKQPD